MIIMIQSIESGLPMGGSVSSAYKCQFNGSIVSFPAPEIWNSDTEHKSKFFVLLVMHNKVVTADNMIKKQYPCNQFCPFCLCF
jgi:hypothetical protein